MAALASLDDVKRILRFTDVDAARDAQLWASLQAVESWADKHLAHIQLSGDLTETYYDVAEDATLQLPVDDGTVTAVRAFRVNQDDPSHLALGVSYDVTPDGMLLLRSSLLVTPFAGAIASRFRLYHERVEVDYTATGAVPRAVTEGLAFLAAGYWRQGPRALAGLLSERIGDYAYTAGSGGTQNDEASYVSQAMFFLTPYLRRKRVMVT